MKINKLESLKKTVDMSENISKEICLALQKQGYAVGVDFETGEVVIKSIENNGDLIDYDTFVTHIPFFFDAFIKTVFQDILEKEGKNVKVKSNFENPILEEFLESAKAKTEGGKTLC